MKQLSRVILFIAVCLVVKDASANTLYWAEDLDFGTVAITNPTQTAKFSLNANSQIRTGSTWTTNATGRGYHSAATVLIPDETMNSVSVKSVASGTLTCTSECSSGAKNITFDGPYSTGSKKANAGVENFWYTGMRLNIPASVGTGVWTGTTTIVLRRYASGSYVDVGTVTGVPIRVKISGSLPPITVAKTQDMNFGTVSTTSAHNVTINPSSCNVSSTSPSGLISTASAKCGIFTIKNEGASAQALTSVTLPSSVTLSGSNGGAMSLDITSYPAVSSITSVPASTTTSVYVGGTLHVLSSNVAGTYSGNYTITVNY